MTADLMSYTKVDRNNLGSLLPGLQLSIAQASFISIDTEFTGLGNSKLTKAQNIEDRFAALRTLASSHAVIALGISIFTRKGKHQNQYSVQNFHFSLLSIKEHLISPSSMSFLVQHGFDFNDQYKTGIPYLAGDDQVMETCNNEKHPNTLLRRLFLDILLRKCPVILHNGFLDLIFIYQSLYASLPTTLPVFVADINEMFAGGIYDTKYISDFISREKASFLALLCRKYQRIQALRKGQGLPYVEVSFSTSMTAQEDSHIEVPFTLYELGLAPKVNSGSNSSSGSKGKGKRGKGGGKPYCVQFANHGVCLDGKSCSKSHDLDIILDDLEEREEHHQKQNGEGVHVNKKQKVDTNTSISTNTDTLLMGKPDNSEKSILQETEKGGEEKVKSLFEQEHSASFDAYMTGFIFAHQQLLEGGEDHQLVNGESSVMLKEARNKIYLIGKQIPLIIQASKYSQCSNSHVKKFRSSKR